MMFSRSGNRAAREANLIFNQAGRNQVSAESLDLFQVENQDIKFGSLAHALRDRRCAFDKCRVFEIENSALFLAIGVWDIKDIKRRRTLSARPDQFPDARCERPEQDIERRSARLIIDYFQEIKNSADFLAIAAPDIKQIKQIKRRRTLSALPADARCGARDTPSNGFEFIQTAPRQSAEFLNFNQSFLFKGDSENAERR